MANTILAAGRCIRRCLFRRRAGRTMWSLGIRCRIRWRVCWLGIHMDTRLGWRHRIFRMRYEVYAPITERAHRTSSFLDVTPPAGQAQEYVINPQPGYQSGWNGWGPRVQVTWNAPGAVLVHAGGGITVIPPNIWQDNFLTGSTPFAVYPRVNASKSGEIAYGFQITPSELPQTYTPSGENVFASGDPKKVP